MTEEERAQHELDLEDRRVTKQSPRFASTVCVCVGPEVGQLSNRDVLNECLPKKKLVRPFFSAS